MDKRSIEKVGIMELPPDQRPREKLMGRGAAFMSDSELLAILIGSGTRQESALTIASRVLSSCGRSPAGLAGCVPQELREIPGIGEAKACVIAAAVELGRRIASSPAALNPKISGPSAAAALCMEEMRRLPKEIFRVLMLNVKSELIMKEDISVGGINSSFSHPREVFSGAVRRGAYSVILMHNHPSGDPTPSPADIAATRQLCEAGKILGIEVVDHILIGDGSYVSFREERLLP
ncbi:MAG: DNA repair protein RadC [Firmicutes bacterium]|nr:DNA repair protein RadC [Bacillota bacterium]MBQ1525438.1 DNA repair protein RadC [Bacillota bacterium]MBQ1887805.1 DNA repair protein RadC [Bacillota bacterium]MBQ2454943.1 DNA repair protein RadC [Bacillota bacterium]MBQ3577482.1 DNA repair protein RadC [Bacillota bacterium]